MSETRNIERQLRIDKVSISEISTRSASNERNSKTKFTERGGICESGDGVSSSLPSPGPWDAAVDDVANDGKLDIVAIHFSAQLLYVFINIGSGTFLSAVSYSTSNGVVAVALVDINNDNMPDVIGTGRSTNTINVLLNTVSGTFSSPTIYPDTQGPWGLAVNDVNGDGRPDMVVTDYNGNKVDARFRC